MSPYVRYKPMPNEKVERNKDIYEYHLKHPKAYQSEIGDKFGITESAVCRIIQRMKKASADMSLPSGP